VEPYFASSVVSLVSWVAQASAIVWLVRGLRGLMKVSGGTYNDPSQNNPTSSIVKLGLSAWSYDNTELISKGQSRSVSSCVAAVVVFVLQLLLTY